MAGGAERRFYPDGTGESKNPEPYRLSKKLVADLKLDPFQEDRMNHLFYLESLLDQVLPTDKTHRFLINFIIDSRRKDLIDSGVNAGTIEDITGIRSVPAEKTSK